MLLGVQKRAAAKVRQPRWQPVPAPERLLLQHHLKPVHMHLLCDPPQVNMEMGMLDPKIAKAIIQAASEVWDREPHQLLACA